MTYNLITTDKMDSLLDACIHYLLFTLKNKQAASHLLNCLENVYEHLELNPFIFPKSKDSFLNALNYHEAIISDMNYILIYKVVNINVYILGIFHCLEDYSEKIKIIWHTDESIE